MNNLKKIFIRKKSGSSLPQKQCPGPDCNDPKPSKDNYCRHCGLKLQLVDFACQVDVSQLSVIKKIPNTTIYCFSKRKNEWRTNDGDSQFKQYVSQLSSDKTIVIAQKKWAFDFTLDGLFPVNTENANVYRCDAKVNISICNMESFHRCYFLKNNKIVKKETIETLVLRYTEEILTTNPVNDEHGILDSINKELSNYGVKLNDNSQLPVSPTQSLGGEDNAPIKLQINETQLSIDTKKIRSVLCLELSNISDQTITVVKGSFQHEELIFRENSSFGYALAHNQCKQFSCEFGVPDDPQDLLCNFFIQLKLQDNTWWQVYQAKFVVSFDKNKGIKLIVGKDALAYFRNKNLKYFNSIEVKEGGVFCMSESPFKRDEADIYTEIPYEFDWQATQEANQNNPFKPPNKLFSISPAPESDKDKQQDSTDEDMNDKHAFKIMRHLLQGVSRLAKGVLTWLGWLLAFFTMLVFLTVIPQIPLLLADWDFISQFFSTEVNSKSYEIMNMVFKLIVLGYVCALFLPIIGYKRKLQFLVAVLINAILYYQVSSIMTIFSIL